MHCTFTLHDINNEHSYCNPMQDLYFFVPKPNLTVTD